VDEIGSDLAILSPFQLSIKGFAGAEELVALMKAGYCEVLQGYLGFQSLPLDILIISFLDVPVLFNQLAPII
jgi:hypothetical protein